MRTMAIFGSVVQNNLNALKEKMELVTEHGALHWRVKFSGNANVYLEIERYGASRKCNGSMVAVPNGKWAGSVGAEDDHRPIHRI